MGVLVEPVFARLRLEGFNKEYVVSDKQWLMRVDSGLSAHFKQPGGSVPGVMWSIGMKRGEQIHIAMVKTIPTNDSSEETKKDQQYQSQMAMQCLRDQLKQGWNPSEGQEHTIWIADRVGKRKQRRLSATGARKLAACPRTTSMEDLVTLPSLFRFLAVRVKR